MTGVWEWHCSGIVGAHIFLRMGGMVVSDTKRLRCYIINTVRWEGVL